jgi:hypothetical protein
MRKYKFSKTFDIGTLYRAETDKAYVFRAVGTDVQDTVVLKVAGAPCLEIHGELAPSANTSNNRFGKLDLENLYVVVPPTKTFIFESSSSGKVVVDGELIELGPGEAISPELAGRFTAQPRHYMSFERATLNIGTTWDAGVEHTVINVTTPVKEEYIFARRIGIDVDNLPAVNDAPGNIAARFYIEDKALDNVESTMGRYGLDFWQARLPPRSGKSEDIGTLKDMPIDLTEGLNLKVKLVNVSGATITSTAPMILKVNMQKEKKISA